MDDRDQRATARRAYTFTWGDARMHHHGLALASDPDWRSVIKFTDNEKQHMLM